MPTYYPFYQTTAGRTLLSLGLVSALALTGCSDNNSNGSPGEPEGPVAPELVDRAYYVLPPGNYGGLPTTDNSLDQLPLYDGLTPLRGNVTDADIEQLFIPENFEPVGEPLEEGTGRPGTTILYDEFGIAHIKGETREDMIFGAGWVTARDRGLWLSAGRGPARAAVADVPGLDAFGIIVNLQTYVPSAAAEQLVTDQVDLIIDVYGDEGRQMIADAQAYADGINAYWEAAGSDEAPFTVNDVVAITSLIGSIFGAGGGEASNADFLATLIDGLGDGPGQLAWEDAMLFDDPEAPTTITTRFDYGPLTGGAVTGSAVIDKDSVISIDPRDPDLVAASRLDAQGKFNLSYCGNGDLDACRASLWQVVEDVSQELAVERGDDPSTWLKEGARLGFTPGLIPATFRATNRPTFQQVLEFVPEGASAEN